MIFPSLGVLLASPYEMPYALGLVIWVLVPAHLLAAVVANDAPVPICFWVGFWVQLAALAVLVVLGLKWKRVARHRVWFFCLGYPLIVFATNLLALTF